MEETIKINGKDVKIVCNYPDIIDVGERGGALQMISEMFDL